MSRGRRLLYYLDCPCAGGANLLILYLVREVERAGGWDVSIVYRRNPPFSALLERLIPASVPRLCAPFPERVELIDLLDGAVESRLVRLAGRAALRLLDYAVFPLELAFLWLAFRSRRPALVHINNGGYPGALGCRAAALAAAAAGVPVLMNVHNQARPWSVLDCPPDRLVDAAVGAYVTASASAKDALAARGFPADKISCIQNGVPAPDARPAAEVRRELGLSPDDVVWAVTAWFEPRKGQAVLIEALARLKRSGALPPRLRVLLVGEGPELAAVRRAVREAGLDGVASFLGYRADAADILNCADGLVLPSLHSEDMPLIVLDAMALGKPVLASSLPGVVEEVEDGRTGRLVAPGDPDALARELAALSADPALRAELGRAGRARFEELFDIQRAHPRYAELYDRLTQQPLKEKVHA